jgi:TonB family protein
MKVSLLTIAIAGSLLYTMPALSESSVYKSHRFPEHPLIEQLIPWFSGVQKKIEADSGYQRMANLFLAGGAQQHYVSCNLTLKENGEIERVTILQTSGSDAIDYSALELLRHAEPFGAPPNDLPTRAGMTVTFTNHQGRFRSEIRPHYLPEMLRIGAQNEAF